MKYNWSKEIKKKINDSFLDAIKESNLAIETFSSRSTKKVTSIHKWFAESIELIIGNDFLAFASGYRDFVLKGKPRKEAVIQGKYFEKNVDVAIVHKNDIEKIEAVVEIKYHCNNLSQNQNNNIENLLGYTVNVRGNNMLFGNLIIAKIQTPYYDKAGKLIKFENHSNSTWQKYEKILNDPKSLLHRPDGICICLIKDGTEEEMKKYVGTNTIIKNSELRKEMLSRTNPSLVESPNIKKTNYLEYGPADFIDSFAVKIMINHNYKY